MACASPQGSDILFPIIPQEIINSTIDLLEGDAKCLQAAGLVQRSWYHRTREHLFRKVVFRGRNLEVRSVQLKKLLDDSPILVQYIKQLALRKPTFSLSDLSHFIAIAPLLTSLTGLTMDCFNWASLPNEIVTSLHELMSNPRVHKLAFINVYNLDIAPLSQFHNLKELVLRHVRQPFGSSVPSLKPRTSLPALPTPDDRLRILDIDDCGRVFETLIKCAGSANGTLDIFHPTTIKVGPVEFDDMEEAWSTVLEKCGSCVENYNVLQDVDPFPPELFALRYFPKLKCFNARVTSRYYNLDSENPLAILLEELDHLSQSGTPRDLSKFILEFGFRDPGELGVDFASESDDLPTLADSDFWAKLDSLLAKPAYSQLDTLRVAFDITNSGISNAEWEEARTKVLSAMPKLGARPGVVEVRSYRM